MKWAFIAANLTELLVLAIWRPQEFGGLPWGVAVAAGAFAGIVALGFSQEHNPAEEQPKGYDLAMMPLAFATVVQLPAHLLSAIGMAVLR